MYSEDDIKLLSLGTGEVTGSVDANATASESNTRIVMTLLDSIFDGVAKAAHKQMVSVFKGSLSPNSNSVGSRE